MALSPIKQVSYSSGSASLMYLLILALANRLDRILESENDYFKRNESFTKKKEAIRTALLEYLAYFDMNPEAEINIQKDKGEDSR
jgi:hypothetical protein